MKYNNILATSDCIIDKDVGLLKLIQYYYRNTDLFFDDILDALTLEQQQYLLIHRTNINPLSVIVSEDNWDRIDSMYEQFVSSEYDRIVDLSCNTNVFSMIKLVVVGETPERWTIVCNTDHEAEVINSRLRQFGSSGVSTTVTQNCKDIDLSKYDELFVKYIGNIPSFGHVEDKMVYISDQSCNMLQTPEGENILNLSHLNNDTLDNTLYTFSLYNFKGNEIVG